MSRLVPMAGGPWQDLPCDRLLGNERNVPRSSIPPSQCQNDTMAGLETPIMGAKCQEWRRRRPSRKCNLKVRFPVFALQSGPSTMSQIFPFQFVASHMNGERLSTSSSWPGNVRSAGFSRRLASCVAATPPQFRPQHFLYFFPDPQGHGSLRPTFPCRGGDGRLGSFSNRHA